MTEPIRTCVGCRERSTQDRLVRLVLDAGGAISVDRTGPGRGAWLCLATFEACAARAIRARALTRAFRVEVDSSAAAASLASAASALHQSASDVRG